MGTAKTKPHQLLRETGKNKTLTAGLLILLHNSISNLSPGTAALFSFSCCLFPFALSLTDTLISRSLGFLLH